MDQQKEGQRDKAVTTYYPLGSILRKKDPKFLFCKKAKDHFYKTHPSQLGQNRMHKKFKKVLERSSDPSLLQ